MNLDPIVVQNIIREIIQVTRDNPDMSVDRVLLEAEEKTSALFKSLTPSEEAPKPKPKSRKRAARHDRQDHVGRFFLYPIKKDLLNAKVQDYLNPIFAKSVQTLIGEDSYNRLSEKILRLLSFGEKKGYDYNQIMASKPGKEIASEIMALYREEASGKSFEMKLKNQLDETLIKFHVPDKDEEVFNIEEAINTAYSEFIRLINSFDNSPAKI